MQKMRTAIGIVAAAALLVSISACSQEAAEPGTETLTIGVINDFPPFGFEENGELTGVDIEVVNAILEEEGLKGDFVVMGFDGLIPALQSGQIDLAAAAISVTDERKKVIDYTDPYFTDYQAVAVLAGSDITTVEDLEGKTIAAVQGTTGLVVATDLAAQYGATVQTLTTNDAQSLALTSGQADAIVNDRSGLEYRVTQDGDDPVLRVLDEKLDSAPTAIAVPKGNEELVAKLNAGLKAITEDGTLDAILAKYFG
jgi:glutamine transport system substrate-binding protein